MAATPMRDRARGHQAAVVPAVRSRSAKRFSRPQVPPDGATLAVGLVTYNSETDLRRTMPRTARVATSLRAELCVFDNGSTDSSVAIASSIPTAKVFANRANRGFAYGVNRLFAMTAANHLLLLNPDVDLVDGNTVSRLLRHFDDPGVGVVAPRLLNPDGSVQESARRFPTVLGIAKRLSPLQVGLPRARAPVAVPASAETSDGPGPVDWAIGAALLIHRAAFDAAHGWDQRFFLYLEDVDFCLRARSAGWRTIYDPTVALMHTHHRASHGSTLLTSKARRDHVRSMVRFFAKHRSLAPRPEMPPGSGKSGHQPR